MVGTESATTNQKMLWSERRNARNPIKSAAVTFPPSKIWAPRMGQNVGKQEVEPVEALQGTRLATGRLV